MAGSLAGLPTLMLVTKTGFSSRPHAGHLRQAGRASTTAGLTAIKSPSTRIARMSNVPSAALRTAPPAVDSGRMASVFDRMSTSQRDASTCAAMGVRARLCHGHAGKCPAARQARATSLVSGVPTGALRARGDSAGSTQQRAHLRNAPHHQVANCGRVTACQGLHQDQLVPALHLAASAGHKAAAPQQCAVAAQQAVARLRLNHIANTNLHCSRATASSPLDGRSAAHCQSQRPLHGAGPR